MPVSWIVYEHETAEPLPERRLTHVAGRARSNDSCPARSRRVIRPAENVVGVTPHIADM